MKMIPIRHRQRRKNTDKTPRQNCIRRLLTGVAVCLLSAALTIPAVAENWYFKKTEDHSQPVPDAAQREITKYGGYYADTAAEALGEKVVYLTFDAGYENGNVEKTLSVLEQHHAPGAFFVLEHFVTANPELIRRMDKAGCLVCNHTCSHRDMAQADQATFEKELTTLETVTREKTGVEIAPFYRPPEGSYTMENLKWAEALGYSTVFWSFAYADWDNDRQPDEKKALDNLLAHTHNGEILLLHPTSATNAAILDSFLTALEQDGYRFGTLGELTAGNPKDGVDTGNARKRAEKREKKANKKKTETNDTETGKRSDTAKTR